MYLFKDKFKSKYFVKLQHVLGVYNCMGMSEYIKKNNQYGFFSNKNNNLKSRTRFVKVNKNKLMDKIFITRKGFRVYDSIIYRRVKIIKRLKNINFTTFNNLSLKYQSLRWIQNYKLIRGLLSYRRKLSFLESQGLKRKVLKRRMTNYAIALADKQKLKIFYIGLKESLLRRFIRKVFLYKNNHLNIFVGLLESRLGSFLFRTNFFSTPLKIKQILKLGIVLVNGKVEKNINYMLIPGDIVSFKTDFLNYFLLNKPKYLKNRFSLFFYPSAYMEVSFSLLEFLFFKKPLLEEISLTFNINFLRILAFYNYIGLK